MADKRKPVIFNIENERERILYEFANEHITNWSKWVKDGLERVARQRGVMIPPPKPLITPVPTQRPEQPQAQQHVPGQAQAPNQDKSRKESQ